MPRKKATANLPRTDDTGAGDKDPVTPTKRRSTQPMPIPPSPYTIQRDQLRQIRECGRCHGFYRGGYLGFSTQEQRRALMETEEVATIIIMNVWFDERNKARNNNKGVFKPTDKDI
ncbi:hypothetical protein XANCAGTX0491_007420 [Xanthoria calcicola]